MATASSRWQRHASPLKTPTAPDAHCHPPSPPALPRVTRWKPRFAMPRPGSTPRLRRPIVSMSVTATDRSIIFMDFLKAPTLSIVVRANAGTHNHRCQLLQEITTPSSNRWAAAYGPAFAGRLAEVLWQAPVARLSHSAAIRHPADRRFDSRQASSRCHGNQLAARAWEVTLRVKSVPNDAFALCL